MTDSLVSKAGIIAPAKAGEVIFTHIRSDEKECSINIKSTTISMYFEMDKEDLEAIKQKINGSSAQIRCNLIVVAHIFM